MARSFIEELLSQHFPHKLPLLPSNLFCSLWWEVSLKCMGHCNCSPFSHLIIKWFKLFFHHFLSEFQYGNCKVWRDYNSVNSSRSELCTSCAEMTSCSSCLEQLGCGWCFSEENPTLGQCTQGNFLQPAGEFLFNNLIDKWRWILWFKIMKHVEGFSLKFMVTRPAPDSSWCCQVVKQFKNYHKKTPKDGQKDFVRKVYTEFVLSVKGWIRIRIRKQLAFDPESCRSG